MAKVKRAETLRILFVGDVVGKPGRAMCSKWLPRLKIEHSVDTIIVNGENSSNCGKGINAKSVAEIFESGANLVTTGNHIWRFKDFYAYLDKTDKVTRPANFPSGCPGRGFAFCDVGDTTIAVLNLQGRVFFKEHLECPFRTAETLLLYLKSKADIVVVDFHSEATSEKEIMGFFLDGKVSAILGTHTHVPTADERILPGGTAYIGDVGSCRALNSSLGIKKETVLQMLLTQMPGHFTVEEKPPYIMGAVLIDVNKDTGKAISIKRLRIEDTIEI